MTPITSTSFRIHYMNTYRNNKQNNQIIYGSNIHEYDIISTSNDTEKISKQALNSFKKNFPNAMIVKIEKLPEWKENKK